MKSVAVTGYFATGSGAIINLLQEYSSIDDGGLSSFEHLFLYDIDGVFDTVDRLLNFNSLFNSNAIINHFRAEMLKLNNNDFGWFGGYKYKCGNGFIDLVETFINEITEYHFDANWYGIMEREKISIDRVVKDLGATIVKGRRINHHFGRKTAYSKNNKYEFSFASEVILKKATKRLVNDYIKLLYKDNNKIALLNHLITPQDAKRMPDYLPDDLYLIIVDRDVRDLFFHNKYIWDGLWGRSMHIFPNEPYEFVNHMKKYRATEQMVNHKRILKVQFEDLVYNYEKTVKTIEDFLGISPSDHINEKKFFDPEKSIKNTQLFELKPEWKEEVKIIEQKLPELIYDFPWKNKTSLGEIFDG